MKWQLTWPPMFVIQNETSKGKKKWDFATVVKFMISMESQTLKNELHKYWGYSADCPTNSSFNQRRSQILPSAFEYLFHQFTDLHSESVKNFKGYRLIAYDGSDINIAYDDKDHSSFFPATYNKNRGFNQLHLNAMYDLIGKIYVDAIIQPGRKENVLAQSILLAIGYDINKLHHKIVSDRTGTHLFELKKTHNFWHFKTKKATMRRLSHRLVNVLNFSQ